MFVHTEHPIFTPGPNNRSELSLLLTSTIVVCRLQHGGHSPGKPEIVREFKSGQGKFREKGVEATRQSSKYEVEGARSRGIPKKTWRKIVEKDCQACKLNKEDALDRIRLMKQIRGD